jgi:poly(A) polymerase
MMSGDPRREHAVEVVARLRSHGHEAYFAGGCVRDLLMGHAPADYDVATSARPEQVMALYRRVCNVGISFGVVRVLGNAESGDVEVATFRSDGAYLDGRRPETVTYSTAEFDASRRDFTINGMFFDPIEERVIDYVGGRADLAAGILRAIGDPFARFTEDKLRLLRAIRFTARFEFAIDPVTKLAVEQMAPQVTTVSVERIAQELRKMLVDRKRVYAMTLSRDTGLIAAILPWVANLREEHWDQTLQVLGKLPDQPSFPLALAALLRNVGKPGEGHELRSVEIAHEVATYLKLSNSERDQALRLLKDQSALRHAREGKLSRLKKLLAADHVDDFLNFHRVIEQTELGTTVETDYAESFLRDQPEGPIDPPVLVTGHDLVKHGLKPGKQFAVLLDKVRDAQLDLLIHDQSEALGWVEQYLKDQTR